MYHIVICIYIYVYMRGDSLRLYIRMYIYPCVYNIYTLIYVYTYICIYVYVYSGVERSERHRRGEASSLFFCLPIQETVDLFRMALL